MSVVGSIRRGCPDRRRGAAALELALIMPLLMVIVLGCVDFGRFVYTYIAVTNAARVGASFGSTHPVTSITWPLWEQQIRDAIAAELGPAFDPAQIVVPAPVIKTDANALKRVSVQVSYPFATLVTWPALPNSITLTRTVQMRVIR